MVNKYFSIINDKVDCALLDENNYISTDNMLPNFGGVCSATSVPLGKCNLFECGDILFSNIRPYFRKIWYSNRRGGTSPDVLVIRSNEKTCLSRFLYYYLCSDGFLTSYILGCKGTKMPRGDKNVFKTYKFDIPDFNKQQHIVDTI